MKYTQIPVNTFQQLQMNAGILATTFNPTTGEVSGLLGATSGGISFADTPEYVDLGEDIDNCPKNTKELKRISGREIKVTGNFVSLSPALAKNLIASADLSGTTHIIPRDEILNSDFETIWFIGDYSDVNTGANAGFIAIKLMNALNTDGFQIQTSDDGKGMFAFGYTAHYSIETPEIVPYEMYVVAGSDPSAQPMILLNKHELRLVKDTTETLEVITIPRNVSLVWASSSDTVATVTSGGVVEGVATGNSIITVTMTTGGVAYSDTCTVIVTNS